MAIPMQAPLQNAESNPDWSTLQGTTLDGGYELKDILSADSEMATFRVRVLGDYSLKATARFFALSGPAASAQVGCWEIVRRLERSASVRRPLGTGILRVNGLQVAYTVVPEAEETLVDALNVRALSGEEAKDVLRSAAKGLSELHAAGLVHGCISPGEILATRDAVLLSGECVRAANSQPLLPIEARYIAPESDRENVTAASDVWCLGATLVEALTQKEHERINAGVVETLEHPFGKVADCCLQPDPDLRCKPGDLEALLRAPKTQKATVQPIRPTVEATPKPPPAPAATGVAATPGPAEVAQPELRGARNGTPSKTEKLPNELAAAKSGSGIASEKLPNELGGAFATGKVAEEKLPNELARRVNRPVEPSRGFPRGWLYGLAAVAVIFLLVLLLRPKTRPTQPSGPTQNAASATPPVAAPGSAWPTKTLGPGSTPQATAPTSKSAAPSARSTIAPSRTPAPVSVAAAANADNPANWRVVLFTFNRQQDADTRAAALNAKHPGLDAKTFSPSGSGSPYLVVAGNPVTRDEAARLKARALRSGMPRDTYIQNFSR